MIKKIIVVCMVLLCGCTKTTTHKSDMSGYEGFTDENHVFYDMTVKDMVSKMNQKDTFVVYFGFSECPYCIQAMPILNTVAKENNQTIGYINTRKDSSWESNTDIDDYDEVVDIFGEYLEYDDEGKKHLYTPHVFFIKEGNVVYQFEGVSDTLSDIYQEGFDAIN